MANDEHFFPKEESQINCRKFRLDCGPHSFKVSIGVIWKSDELSLFVIIYTAPSLYENTGKPLIKFGPLPLFLKIWSIKMESFISMYILVILYKSIISAVKGGNNPEMAQYVVCIRPLAGKKKLAYLERSTPNHPPSSSLGTPHTSPSGAAIVGSMPRKPLSEWSLARLSLLP